MTESDAESLADRKEEKRMSIRIIRAKDYDDMSRKAANIIAAQVISKPDSVLGLATGSTPIGTYKELVARYQAGDLDFSEITSVNLDEYKGLDRENDLFQTHLQQGRMIRLAKGKRLAWELSQILDKMKGKTTCGRGFFL